MKYTACLKGLKNTKMDHGQEMANGTLIKQEPMDCYQENHLDSNIEIKEEVIVNNTESIELRNTTEIKDENIENIAFANDIDFEGKTENANVNFHVQSR